MGFNCPACQQDYYVSIKLPTVCGMVAEIKTGELWVRHQRADRSHPNRTMYEAMLSRVNTLQIIHCRSCHQLGRLYEWLHISHEVKTIPLSLIKQIQ